MIDLGSAEPNVIADLQVLLVEDDDILRLSLEDRMRLEGLSARSAASVADARQVSEDGDG